MLPLASSHLCFWLRNSDYCLFRILFLEHFIICHTGIQDSKGIDSKWVTQNQGNFRWHGVQQKEYNRQAVKSGS